MLGMVGSIVLYAGIVENHFTKQQKDNYLNDKINTPTDIKFEEIIDDILRWFLTDKVNSMYLQKAGATVFMIAPIAWGYSYAMTYFLFLEAADPGCGALDRDDVYSK